MEALVDARFLDVVAHDPAGRIRLRLDGLARIFARELYSDI